MPTPCQMGLRDYITWPSYNPHSQIIPHSPTPWRPRFITTQQYFEHSMAQSWWGGGSRAIPLKGTTFNMLNPFSAAVSSERPYRHGRVLTQKEQHPVQPSTRAFQGRGCCQGSGGPAGTVTGQPGDVPAGQSGQIQPGVAAKSVAWHSSTSVLIEIIKHCVGNPEKHPSCSVCRWNPPCVQVPASPPAPPLSPPDSILFRLYPCATPPRWESRAINAKCALLLG